jgi:hypothetical protein
MNDRCEDEILLKWRHGAGRLKKTAALEPPRIPRITRLMALAIKFQGMVDRGDVRDYADLARLGCVTGARLTQIMNLLLLAPDLQERLLFGTSPVSISERIVRAVCTQVEWADQRRHFRGLMEERQTASGKS